MASGYYMDAETQAYRQRQKKKSKRNSINDDNDDEEISSFDSESVFEKSQDKLLQQEDEIDPLDAYMATLNPSAPGKSKPKGERMEFQKETSINMDNTLLKHETSLSYVEEKQEKGEWNIATLMPLVHANIIYETFRKAFYIPHHTIRKSNHHVNDWRTQHAVHISGIKLEQLSPIQSFSHAGLDRTLLNCLAAANWTTPTVIQAQTLPVALSGRDMIGVAKTGSGKTLAFVVPMMVHVMDQRELKKGEGPIALIIAPTRELSVQIHSLARKFAKHYDAGCVCVYGGVQKWEQIQAVSSGVEIVVGTPGRLIEMIRKKNLTLRRTTYLVLDEADLMFNMGFEPQLRSIVGQIRPDRQTLLFSATFPKKVEYLARDILTEPIKIVIGQHNQANSAIQQQAIVLRDDGAKWNWLQSTLSSCAVRGKVLIFVKNRAGCDELCASVTSLGVYAVGALHGDKCQEDRSKTLRAYRSGNLSVLVATDVAARGLDVPSVGTVINYDVPKNIETHIHRIGRTGRGDVAAGIAFTLVTYRDASFAGRLVNNFDVSGQVASDELVELAEKDAQFQRRHHSKHSHNNSFQEFTPSRNSRPVKRTGLGFHRSSSSHGPSVVTGPMGFVPATHSSSKEESRKPVDHLIVHEPKKEPSAGGLQDVIARINASCKSADAQEPDSKKAKLNSE